MTLDGATSSFNSPTGPEVYEALLFEQQGLPDGLHTVELVNTATTEGRSWLDLDVVGVFKMSAMGSLHSDIRFI